MNNQRKEILFKSDAHKERFIAMMQAIGKVHDGEYDPEYGSELFPAEEEFTIVAYQQDVQVGYGVYRVHLNDMSPASLLHEPEPVNLHVVRESGAIEGVMQEAWKRMIEEEFGEEE